MQGETMANTDSHVTIHMAASLDGFIARKDGSVDWLETSDEFVRETRQRHRPPFGGSQSLQERHGGASIRGARIGGGLGGPPSWRAPRLQAGTRKGARRRQYAHWVRSTGRITMPKHYVFVTKFAKVYPLYIQKAERKNRTKEEVDQIICWLTGYNQAGLQQQIEQENDLETFFGQAPGIHPNSALIKGVVCGVRVEEIEDPLMQKIRYLDKLIDELAKGKTMEKILRQ